MIYIKSYVKVSDSSGARIASVIKVLRSKFYHGKLTDTVIVSVKVARPERKVKRRNICKATIIRLSKYTHRYEGTQIRFNDNAVVVYNVRNEIWASRLFGPVVRELRFGKNVKIISMAGAVVQCQNTFIN